MTDIAASLGLVALRRFDADRRRRAEIWRCYDEAFADLPLSRPPGAPAGTKHGRHLYSLLVDVERLGHTRDWVRERLYQRGIGTGVHYIPVHHHPVYRDLPGTGPGQLTNADHIGECTFSLPFNADLTDEDVADVIAEVRAVCSA